MEFLSSKHSIEADDARVFLDACTLVPASLRDLLLRCAYARLFRVHWSSDVLEEVRRTLIDQLLTLIDQLLIPADRVNYLLATMRKAFPEAEIHGYTDLRVSLDVDPGDHHVLAAAIVAEVNVLVTRNVRHFPVDALAQLGIELCTPDELLLKLLDVYTVELHAIVESRSIDLGDSMPETLGFLRLHVPLFVERFESHRAE